MLNDLFIGASDVALSAKFYSAVLGPLGYLREELKEAIRFSPAGAEDRDYAAGSVWVQRPFNGKPATPGNGMMPAFRVGSPQAVDAIHAAGLAAGGADEGAPGTRGYYSDTFYVAYLRDPVGNKLSVFCVLPKSFFELLLAFPGETEFERDTSQSRETDI